MKFREYLAQLNEIATKNPETLDLDVVTADDDEGNSYSRVSYSPTIGHLNDEEEFIGADSFEEWDLNNDDTNAICIN
jgi:hypothetical protein